MSPRISLRGFETDAARPPQPAEGRETTPSAKHSAIRLTAERTPPPRLVEERTKRASRNPRHNAAHHRARFRDGPTGLLNQPRGRETTPSAKHSAIRPIAERTPPPRLVEERTKRASRNPRGNSTERPARFRDGRCASSSTSRREGERARRRACEAPSQPGKKRARGAVRPSR